MGGCAAVGRGQLIGPIPGATAPTPRYVVPQVVEPGVVPTPENEPPAPSIVARDEQGRLRAIAGTPEEAAVAAYALDAARRERVVVSAAARKVDLDRFVITNLDKVLAAQKMRERVRSESEFGKLFEARDLTVALRFERLIDRLERDGAVTGAQRVRLDETLLAYDRARKAEIDTEAGSDPTRTGVLNLRQTFADAMREPFESLERQTRDVGEHLGELKAVLKLGPDQERAYAEWESMQPSSHATDVAARFVRETLDLEQQRAGMTARLVARSPAK